VHGACVYGLRITKVQDELGQYTRGLNKLLTMYPRGPMKPIRRCLRDKWHPFRSRCKRRGKRTHRHFKIGAGGELGRTEYGQPWPGRCGRVHFNQGLAGNRNRDRAALCLQHDRLEHRHSFQKPFTLSDTAEPMVGAGWAFDSTFGGTTKIGAEFALDFMFWPWPGRKHGWFLEPELPTPLSTVANNRLASASAR
jgi:hypothetical protein